MRNRFYDWGWFSSQTYDFPLIGIGNLSVGGTGKTPMVEYVLRELAQFRVAMLSRGYGRKTNGFVRAQEGTGIRDIGDEPFQIHQKFPEVSVAVDGDRRHGIATLLNDSELQALVLDDVYQHRKVKPGLLILLTMFGDLYVDDGYLPSGNLRDHKKEVRRAHVVIVTKCPEDLEAKEKELIIQKLALQQNQRLLFSHLQYDDRVVGSEGKTPLDALNTPFCLVTGIANPEPLVRYLKTKGLEFEHLAYADHHYFSDAEVQQFNAKELVLTTEKDYVRLKGRVKNLYALGVRHAFAADDARWFSNTLQSYVKNGA
jgi:tetraacyldisaccharide 4'-kinase